MKPEDKKPRWKVDSDAGTISRAENSQAPFELVAKWEPRTGVVELMPDMHKYRLPVTNVMNGENGGYFTHFGKIDLVEKPPADAPKKPGKAYRHGEKQPERVEWEARYMPETFMAKWGVFQLQVRVGYDEVERIRTKKDGTGDRERYMDKMPLYENRDGFNFDVDKIIDGEQRLLAHAKTHLTAKAEESPDLSEYDDSLDRPDDAI